MGHKSTEMRNAMPKLQQNNFCLFKLLFDTTAKIEIYFHRIILTECTCDHRLFVDEGIILLEGHLIHDQID
jgi:hypothetical protein